MNNAWKWILGFLTGGVAPILIELGERIPNAINEMKNEQKSKDTALFDALSDDPVKYGSDAFSSSSTDPYLSYRSGSSSPNFSSDDNAIGNWLTSKTGSGLTENERLKMMYETWERQQSENFTHNEAVDARMWQQYMESNKYSWNTESMQNAGLNPAMVYGGGNLVSTNATGAMGSSSPGSAPSAPNTGSLVGLLDVLMTMMRMPSEIKRTQAEAQRARDEGAAALKNADSNARNAGANERNASTNEREVAVHEAELQIKKELKDNDIRLTDEQIRLMAEQRLNVAEVTKYVSKNYDVAVKNASSAEKQAIAAMRQADAAVQNAATNDYLSTYQTDMMYSQRLGQDIMNGKSDLELKYLPDKLAAEVKEFQARGFYFTAQGELANKNKALVTAQTIRQYELMVTDVANAVVNVAGAVATGGLSGAMKGSTSVTYDPAPANGTYGTYGDMGTVYWFNQ